MSAQKAVHRALNETEPMILTCLSRIPAPPHRKGQGSDMNSTNIPAKILNTSILATRAERLDTFTRRYVIIVGMYRHNRLAWKYRNSFGASPKGSIKTATGLFILNPVIASLPLIPNSYMHSNSECSGQAPALVPNIQDLKAKEDEALQRFRPGTTLHVVGAVFENEFLMVRKSSLGGWGAFAKRQLKWGEHILLEQPLIQGKLSEIYDAFDKLDDYSKAVILSLQAYFPSGEDHDPRLWAVWITNRSVGIPSYRCISDPLASLQRLRTMAQRHLFGDFGKDMESVPYSSNNLDILYEIHFARKE